MDKTAIIEDELDGKSDRGRPFYEIDHGRHTKNNLKK